MKNSILYVLLSISISGCANFDFVLGGMGSVVVFQLQSPTPGTALVSNTSFTIQGICDPLGGTVTLTGTSFIEASVNGACDPVTGTFSITATSGNNGQTLDIQGTQTDVEGLILDSSITNINIHCAGAPMRACALSGSGNPADPYNVSTISCLQEMRTGLSCHYALANNIDASATSTWNSNGTNNRGWEPVPNSADNNIRFTGTLDGRNRTITNLFLTPRQSNGAGLFSRISDEGNGTRDVQVYDLTFVNPTMQLYDLDTPTGFLAGRSFTTAFRSVHIEGGTMDIQLNTPADDPAGAARHNSGGLIGEGYNIGLSDSHIENLTIIMGNPVETTAGGHNKYDGVGLIAGYVGGSSLTDLNIQGTIQTSTSNALQLNKIGGAVGYFENSEVSRLRLFPTMRLTTYSTDTRATYMIGGLAGRSHQSHYSQVCVEADSIYHTHVSNIDVSNGLVGEMQHGNRQYFDQVSLKGRLDIYSAMQAGTTGVLIGYGNLSFVNFHVDQTYRILQGTPYGGWGWYSGFGDLTAGNEFSNLVLLSHATLPAGFSGHGIGGDSSQFASIDNIILADDDGLSPFGAGAPFTPSANKIKASRSAIAAMPSSNLGTLDFVSVWTRDPVTNLPELRFCN